jgi:hypothetical protein
MQYSQVKKGYPKLEKITLTTECPVYSFRVVIYISDWQLSKPQGLFHQLKYRILGQDFFVDLGPQPK